MKHELTLAALTAGLAVVFLFGCTEEVSEKKKEVRDAVLVSVNGVSLTKAEVERLVAANVKIRKHREAATQRIRKPQQAQVEEQQLLAYAQGIRRGAVDNFIVRQLILGSVGAVDVAPSNVTAKLDRIVRGARYANLEALKADLTTEEYEALGRQVAFEARFEEADRQFKETVPATVSEKELDVAFKRLDEINATAAATNRIAFLLATNTYNRIKSGELAFDKAVAEISQDATRNGSGLWGAFKLEDMRKHDPKLAALIEAGAKEGDVLPPVEADNQLLVCKLGPDNRGARIIYRIVFKLALEWKIPTRDKMRESLAFDKRRDVCREKFKALKKAAKIELSSEVRSRIYSNNEDKHDQK